LPRFTCRSKVWGHKLLHSKLTVKTFIIKIGVLHLNAVLLNFLLITESEKNCITVSSKILRTAY